MGTKLRLDQFVDPFEAKVVLTRDDVGEITDARFDLSGLPRLDPMLVGRDVRDVPDIVKRLCGICPVTHHLAGIRALDALHGVDELTPTARNVRLLLHYGSVLDAVAPKLFSRDPQLAVALKKFGKAVMVAAGSEGHFPDVAIPGGVRAPAKRDEAQTLAEDIAQFEVGTKLGGEDNGWEDTFDGLSAVLTRHGKLDPLGDAISTGNVNFAAQSWPEHVVESAPGASAPRPLLDGNSYRVGPIARGRFLGRGDGPEQALDLIIGDALAGIRELLGDPATFEGECSVEVGDLHAGTGVGLVDGPRGLLAHIYTCDDTGTVTTCQILTPTAQNEPWLADMLLQSLRAGEDDEVEESIRVADPCLPCSSAPKGQMGVLVDEKPTT